MNYKGENSWRTPLYRNISLLDDFKKLIDSFLIADRLMGN